MVNKKIKVLKEIKVFISYSWDNDKHNDWVRKLAINLRKVKNVNVIFDQFDFRTGLNKNHYMENSLKRANKVLIILTPNYAKKADNRKGGVGHEYSIINEEISKTINQIYKFLPILRKGNRNISCPLFLKAFIDLDMRKDAEFKDQFKKLIKDIFFDENNIPLSPSRDNPSIVITKKLKGKINDEKKRNIRKS